MELRTQTGEEFSEKIVGRRTVTTESLPRKGHNHESSESKNQRGTKFVTGRVANNAEFVAVFTIRIYRLLR